MIRRYDGRRALSPVPGAAQGKRNRQGASFTINRNCVIYKNKIIHISFQSEAILFNGKMVEYWFDTFAGSPVYLGVSQR